MLPRAPELNSSIYPRHLDRALVAPLSPTFALGLLMFEIGSPGVDVLLGLPVANGDSESVVSSGRLHPQEALTATTVTSGNVGCLCVLGGGLLSSFSPVGRWFALFVGSVTKPTMRQWVDVRSSMPTVSSARRLSKKESS